MSELTDMSKNHGFSGLVSKGIPSDFLSQLKKTVVKMAEPLHSSGSMFADNIEFNENSIKHYLSNHANSYTKLVKFINSLDLNLQPNLYKFVAESAMDYNAQYNGFDLLLSLSSYDPVEIESVFVHINREISKHFQEEVPECLIAAGVLQVFDKDLDEDVAAYNVAISLKIGRDIVDMAIPEDYSVKYKSAEHYYSAFLKQYNKDHYEVEPMKPSSMIILLGLLLSLIALFAYEWPSIQATMGLV